MITPLVVLDVEAQFDLMVRYQRTIESKSTLIEHSPADVHSHGLYTIAEPVPTFEEYLQGNDFAEDVLIEASSDIVQLERLQDQRRK